MAKITSARRESEDTPGLATRLWVSSKTTNPGNYGKSTLSERALPANDQPPT